METNTQLTAAVDNDIDTNAEYISAEGIETQPPIINSVFRSIFIETPKDFYNGIKAFFLRYINLFTDGYRFLKRPSLKIDPFNTKDYKENCQHTFELSMIIIALLIFLIKMDLISSQAKLQDFYNNDVGQMFIELFVFVCFAVSYFVLVVLAVLVGRAFRKLFNTPITRQESDILFTYLNNSLFCVTIIVALILRCVVSYDSIVGNDTFTYGVFIFFILLFGVLILRWAIKFSILNNIHPSKRMLFKFFVTAALGVCLAFCSTIITFFILGV